jgi:protein tyrosine phosphatase (PTP) superfamily phosphohydrolase (DUF442 family)
MWRIAWAGVVLGLIAGCAGHRSRRDTQAVIAPPPPAPVAQGFAPAPGGQGFAPAPGVPPTFPTAPPMDGQFAAPPTTAFPTVPPQGPGHGLPAPPGPSNGFPTAPPGPGAAGAQFPTAPPPGPPPGPMGQIESNWQPAEARAPAVADNRVLLGPPEVTADQSGKDKKLYPPQVEGTPSDAKAPSASLPVGIPQFASVRPQLATGRRPLDNGYEWLKNNRYRTVVNVRLPGENDDADRKQAEDRGLTYVAIEMSPVLVAKDAVEEFFKVVRDPERQPVFVYDRDGALAGGLWYLYFRAVEQDNEEVARIRARGAGLREEREGAHREMWQSVQRYLAENP